MKPRISISIGDLNGIGIAIAFEAHEQITQLCQPLYCISDSMLKQAASLLGKTIPSDFKTVDVTGDFDIEPAAVSAQSGQYAYDSFMKAIALAESDAVDAITTLPIHKEAWSLAGLDFVGHTDLLRRHFEKEAIMMLGCDEMYVALYTEHIPLSKVPEKIEEEALTRFLIDFQRETGAEKIAVLGLNPHAGDNGVLGNEEEVIAKAIANANNSCNGTFHGPLVPDIAFTPASREQFIYFIAMYHDQGLGPLKALYFDESINVSLNLPVIRTSVDHGTAFDIAYRQAPKTQSYLNAIKAAVDLCHRTV
ncbi:MAG: 4-hydroxythreonine-4-phosphate dehydrogenase [Campylobacterota bacterium]|nr:4-hydroxythreonine-4-phosphate dehydrogenase [Campylobacterota bacterium]